MAKDERTGWRDVELINWHWQNGLACQAGGVCLPMLEYNRAQPVALVEYRRYEDGVPHTDHPIYRAMAALAGKLPFLIAYYHFKTWGFCLAPQNFPARLSIGPETLMSEARFCAWLHHVRGDMPFEPQYKDRGLAKAIPPERPSLPMGVPQLLRLDGDPWKGRAISHRHRIFWGKNCPAVDLDHLLIDHNDGTAIALVEYKNTDDINLQHANIAAQECFAGELPFMVVRYWRNPWSFQVVHANRPFRKDILPMGAGKYLSWLRSLRARALPSLARGA